MSRVATTSSSAVWVVMSALAAQGAQAQQAGAEQTPSLQEVTVTGTRRLVVSPTDVSAPVDVIPIDKLTKQGDVDMINVLRNSCPPSTPTPIR